MSRPTLSAGSAEIVPLACSLSVITKQIPPKFDANSSLTDPGSTTPAAG